MKKRRFEFQNNITQPESQISVIESVSQFKNEIKNIGQKKKNPITFAKIFNFQNKKPQNNQQELQTVHPMIMNQNDQIQNYEIVNFQFNNQQKQSTQFNLDEQQTPSFRMKMSSLMKVLYKSDMYLRLNIFINIVYMFGVLIQLPDQMCESSSDFAFRCGLSYYIQVVCLLMICPLFMIKVLRMVGIDSFKCIIELATFMCGILWVFKPLIILRYIKTIRPLRILVIIRDTSLIVPTYNMFVSVRSISKVLFPAILTIYIYAIIGLYTFSDNQYDRCRDTNVLSLENNWTVYEQGLYLCGQRQCPSINGTRLECLNPIDYGVEPNPEELRHIQFGNGLMRYSNIIMSFLITYQNTFITGSTPTILLQKQVLDSVFVLVYYYSFIYLLSYLYFNIFYGLMITNQDNHLQTKEQYQTLMDNSKEIIISPVELKLIRKYERIFNHLNKRIPFFSFNNKKLPNLIYHTHKNIALNNDITKNKRTGHGLDLEIIQKAANEHEVTKKIMKIVEKNQSDTQSEAASICQKFTRCMKRFYYYFNLIVIVLTCVNICLEYANQPYELQKVTSILDIVFFFLFFFDFLVRYFIIISKNQHTFQKQLVVKIPRRIYLQGLLLSVCMTGYLYEILIAENFQDFYMANSKIQKMFRAMLYLRILILMGFQPYFQESRKYIEFAYEAVRQSINFITLWLIVLIMFSMMGYFLFGQCNTPYGQKNCYNSGVHYLASYQGIFQSLITTGIIMFNEDWDTIMKELFLQQGYLIVAWNFIVITFGIMIFSKYFMTYLLNELDVKISENFNKQNLEKVEQKSFLNDLIKKSSDISEQSQSEYDSKPLSEDEKDEQKRIKVERISVVKTIELKSQIKDEKERVKLQTKINFRNNKIAPEIQEAKRLSNSQFVPQNKLRLRKKREQTQIKNDLKIQLTYKQDNPKQDSSQQNSQKQKQINVSPKKKVVIEEKPQKQIINKTSKRKQNQKGMNENNTTTQKPNEIQTYYTKMVWYKILKSLVLVILIVDIYLGSPQNDPNSLGSQISYYSTVIIDSFFVIDMIGQFFSYGLKNWFLRFNFSRYFDLLLNIISIFYFTPLGSHYILRKLYAFRCLRVTYWINLRSENSQQMKVTAKGLIQLVPKILKLLFVVWLIYGFFACIVVRAYKQQMWECVNYPSGISIETKIDCFNYGGDWVEQKLNATNFGEALLYIFLLASSEDWLGTMQYLSVIKGKDMQPGNSNSSLLRIFFMIFMFFANIIVMNIFVGVCINNFKQIKQKATGQTNLSKQQKQWVSIKNQILHLQPEPLQVQPKNEIRKFFFKLAKTKAVFIFKVFQLIGLLILLSFITSNMSHSARHGILIGQYVFLLCGFCIFLIDLIAYGITKNNLSVRIMEIVLYLYGLVFLFLLTLSNLSRHEQRMAGGLLVAIQLFRNFIFIQEFQFFQKMFNSIMKILPKTKDIFLLMIVTLFIYTTIGVQLFGYLKPGLELNQDNSNYVTFGSALFSLIKYSFWQNPIQQIRDGLKNVSPDSVCFQIYDYQSFIKYGQNGCGYTFITLMYFITFNLIFSLILIPTLMGIIFDEYNECSINESASISRLQLQKIKEEWKLFDPQGKGYINCRDFWPLAGKIIKIYKLKACQFINNQSKSQFLKQLNIPVYQGPSGQLCFQFHQLLIAFTKSILIRKQRSFKKRQVFSKEIVFQFDLSRKNTILQRLKKTSYNSSNFYSLLLLKSGLKAWKDKAVNNQREN